MARLVGVGVWTMLAPLEAHLLVGKVWLKILSFVSWGTNDISRTRKFAEVRTAQLRRVKKSGVIVKIICYSFGSLRQLYL